MRSLSAADNRKLLISITLAQPIALRVKQPAILRVAVNVPLSRLFDYLPPVGRDDLVASPLQPGSRILVPFGRQKLAGMIMEHAERSDFPASKLRRAVALIDESPVLGPHDLWLMRFASQYYHHPVGEVVATGLPAALRQGRTLYPSALVISKTAQGLHVDLAELAHRAPRQAELMEAIGVSTTADELDRRVSGWRRLRTPLAAKGWIVEEQRVDKPAPRRRLAPVAGPKLNREQASAVAAIEAQPGFSVSLLDGVTGSGKTEVYLTLMQDVLAAGRQVLIVVPEIGLTPQFLARLEERLGEEPALLHSALTDTERLAAWRDARSGNAGVVLGTRSAIFAPLRNPGLIIVDEEHDNSLKQQEGFRYSARDLAVARGKDLDVPVILGSATPSLESLKRCRDGAYHHLRLPSRAGTAAPPLMRIVDMSLGASPDGLSPQALVAIKRNIEDGGQVLVFLNRRGFAPTLICGGCGKIAECNRCDARMTVHVGDNELRCHHCDARRPIDPNCGSCGGTYRPLGQGTERIEEALREHFPRQSIARIDSDSTRLKGTMDRALALAATGETRILVGTQMLSKGHHFPNLTLVVVVNADQGLFSTDFRGSEKLAQSLVQVAGRAGREHRQGEVLIQSAFPRHPFWSDLFRGGYERIAEFTLAERERAAWPPYTRLVLVRASAHRRGDAHAFLQAARRLLEEAAGEDVRILGPVAAPMERRAGRYRAQLLLQSSNRQALHSLLASCRPALESDITARRVRWSIDVDPIELF